MISPGDIVDAVWDVLKENRDFRKILEQEPERKGKWGEIVRRPFNRPYTSLPAKRIFLTEHDIRKLLSPGSKKLTVPKEAILSPLAQDWISEKGIEIVFQENEQP